jgi:hypothetical protein
MIIIFLVIQNCCEKKVENFEEHFKVDYFTGNGVDEISGEFSAEKGKKLKYSLKERKLKGLGMWNNEVFRLAEINRSYNPPCIK